MKLVVYPDPILRRRAAPVDRVGPTLQRRARRMIEIMHAHNGLGLAAPQAGWSARVFVVNLTGEEGDERVYVNPRIVEVSGEEVFEEGCLSVPEVRAKVVRAGLVTIEARDLRGKPFRETHEELGARALQHEIDHLDGILFISRISEAEKIRIRPALKELEAEHAQRARRLRGKVGP